ncbi:adenosine deaminase-like protein [Anoplophora glabripennis]|uniref:adenosine deaminase-like protein n=1 Tax=Anoplophora glabripennis TaxID=217634 RepID=UPI0008743434|nr:adenosine deaminase-like protein [Anoplophora glabripennis]
MTTKSTIYQFCRALPKIELHAHLNGSLSMSILTELGCMDTSIVRYMNLTDILNKKERALDECFKLFKVAHDATNTPDSVYIATKRVIEEFDHDNVMYLELRTTPRSEENMSKQEYIESVIKAIKENDKNITVKLILSINRSHDMKNSQESLEVILNMKKIFPDIIKGIDLSGNPNVGKFEAAIFKTAKENSLYTTIHCAEVKNDEEVKDILNFGPDRLGHATFLHPRYDGCQENWQLYCEKRIPIECCMTSNVICGTSESYKKHHIQEWIKNGLPFCISTDDKGVFCTSLSEEYEYANEFFDLSKEDMWKVSLNAVDYSFASNAEKLLYKSKLNEWKRDNENLFL